VFPHGATTSIGTGTLQKGFGLKEAVTKLRADTGMDRLETIRKEGAPIPIKPLPRWDNGRDVVIAGDAAGVVAPASGEGIFYAMTGGRLAANAVEHALQTGKASALKQARRQFMKMHGPVFFVLDVMQSFWYSTDNRRERFVAICRDRDVQQLTFDGYMRKQLVRAKPMSHFRIFIKNLAHLAGLAPA
jgi:geranylgeranyl reductase